MQSPTDPTINTYNLYAQVYDDETKEFWSNFPHTTIDLFARHLSGKRVLDLGSGPGHDALLLRERGLDVVCVDASEKMVERTNSLGFESIKSDFRKLKLLKQSFDGVWAYTSLLHVKKEEMNPILVSIHELLKDNGVFLSGMIEGVFDGNKERETMPNSYRYFCYYKEQELKNLIIPTGFDFIEQERYKPHNNTYLSQLYRRV